ncbi:protein SDE2 homolog [Stylophora pistillata]|uniref:Protein SDE2-like n=1 Tax=Stylophora pistillata TaxID=50429 RepID=A0A2B4RQ77_STYPI|nr:protein SDE2 homolog [Stylophora pistillata]PFX18382.1 Protein SDE2-like [Stylophora pistillata]
MSAFLYTCHRKLHCLNVVDRGVANGKQLKKIASDLCGGISEQYLSVIHNGRLVTDDGELVLQVGDVCYASLLLPGGKGGFGSMLRAIGAQIEKTTNREACRDLSGRRMRDINDEKKIAEWVSKQAEREREKEQKKQERLARRRSMPKHMFDDKTYTQNIQQNSERIEDALQQGLKAAGSSTSSGASSTSEKPAGKRVHPEDPKISRGGKKSRMWLGMEDLSDSDNDEEEMAPTGRNSNGDSSSHTNTSTGTSCSSTQVEVSAPEEASDNNQCDTDSYIAKPAAQPSETNAESQKEDTKTEHIGAAVTDTKDQREDFQEKDGLKETVSKGEADNQASEEQTIKKIEFCLDSCTSAEELESLGLEHLKEELISRGLKCGGTLQQRAQRLFASKGVPLDQLDPSFFAKSTGSKKSYGKK